MRFPVIAAVLAVASMIAVPGCSAQQDATNELSAQDYDQSCASDDDCVAVYFGNPSCGCGEPDNGAINKSDLGRYQDDYKSRAPVCNETLQCDQLNYPAVAICSAGACTVEPSCGVDMQGRPIQCPK